MLNLGGEFFLLHQPFLPEGFRVSFEGNIAAHNLDPLAGVEDAMNFDREGKAVQKLWPQVALFRVHRAYQDETRWMAEGNPFAFNHINAHGSRVQQNIDHMVIQQVDFIDVKQTAVGCRQHPGFKMPFTFLNRFFNVERANHPIFSRRDWQVNKRGRAHLHRQWGFA